MSQLLLISGGAVAYVVVCVSRSFVGPILGGVFLSPRGCRTSQVVGALVGRFVSRQEAQGSDGSRDVVFFMLVEALECWQLN